MAKLNAKNQDALLTVLQDGSLELVGLLPWGSNYTFLVDVCHQEVKLPAVYKPRKGERPLWDFPRGTLCQREQAAYLLSAALGWGLVLPTVLRDGPHGWGAVQAFVEHDPDQHYFTFEGRYADQLQRVVLFDVLANNADRKGGHVLLDETGRLWSIDHGICFHVEDKLRTVIWDFAGEVIPADLLADLAQLQASLADGTDGRVVAMQQMLSRQELRALQQRLALLLANPVFPRPGPGRHYPWPPV